MKRNYLTSLFTIVILVAVMSGAIGVTPARAASLVVNSLEDSAGQDGKCTLREAISNADGDSEATGGDCAIGSGADTISFSVSGTISLGSELPHINNPAGITLDGTGQTVTIDGGNANRVIVVGPGVHVTLNHLTIAHGNAGANGGGAYNNGGTLTISNSAFVGNSASGTNLDGGGIYNNGGTVTITNSSFSLNTATGTSFGGAIFSDAGRLSITGSTFANNSATTGGAIVSSSGPLTITNSTFSTNTATTGGGIYTTSSGSLDVVNSTFSGNSATTGGGIYNSSNTVVTISNSILTNSPSGGNCGGTITNGGNNIDDGITCGWGSTNGSMSSTNPLLGGLANNGGSTLTFSPLAGSRAIDGVTFNPPNGAPSTDQRGRARPQGVRYDIGALEANTTVTYYSTGGQDGWVLEKSENANVGATRNASAGIFNIGDDASRRQYRVIVSFNTGPSMPDTAVITSITLKIKRKAIVGGGNPLTIFQGFMVDIRKGVFGTLTLEPGDFQAVVSKTYGPFTSGPVGGWYVFNLSSAYRYINKLSTGSGLTQIRLRFKLDDNNNAAANYMTFYSGSAGVSNRPQLSISYFIP